MKNKKTYLLSLLLFGLGLTCLHAQNKLSVNEKDGTQTSFNLNEVRKLSFPTGEMMVSNANGTAQMFVLSNIRLLKFEGTVNSVDLTTLHENGSIFIYPNPVIDELILVYESTNLGSLQISIVDLQGKVVYRRTEIQTNGQNQLTIKVSNLPTGLYICRLMTGSTIVTSKFLKN